MNRELYVAGERLRSLNEDVSSIEEILRPFLYESSGHKAAQAPGLPAQIPDYRHFDEQPPSNAHHTPQDRAENLHCSGSLCNSWGTYQPLNKYKGFSRCQNLSSPDHETSPPLKRPRLEGGRLSPGQSRGNLLGKQIGGRNNDMMPPPPRHPVYHTPRHWKFAKPAYKKSPQQRDTSFDSDQNLPYQRPFHAGATMPTDFHSGRMRYEGPQSELLQTGVERHGLLGQNHDLRTNHDVQTLGGWNNEASAAPEYLALLPEKLSNDDSNYHTSSNTFTSLKHARQPWTALQPPRPLLQHEVVPLKPVNLNVAMQSHRSAVPSGLERQVYRRRREQISEPNSHPLTSYTTENLSNTRRGRLSLQFKTLTSTASSDRGRSIFTHARTSQSSRTPHPAKVTKPQGSLSQFKYLTPISNRRIDNSTSGTARHTEVSSSPYFTDPTPQSRHLNLRNVNSMRCADTSSTNTAQAPLFSKWAMRNSNTPLQ